MPKKGHTEEQIVAVLRQAEAGEKVNELCRKVGISEATYYAWKKQYAGLGVPLRRPLIPCRTIWLCRDRATTTCNLLDFNGTDSPFLIL